MAFRLIVLSLLLAFVVISGCTQTGRIVDESGTAQSDISNDSAGTAVMPQETLTVADAEDRNESAGPGMNPEPSTSKNDAAISGMEEKNEPQHPGPEDDEEVPANEPCMEDWECGDWSECDGETMTRSCHDRNGCSDDYSEKEGCECSLDSHCDDDDACTEDHCSSDWECVIEEIIPCCGNGKCEDDEDYDGCPEDCEKPPEPGEGGAEIIICGVMYDGLEPGNERDEWVALMNTGSGDAVLSGWFMGDNAKNWTLPNITIAGGERVVITRNSTVFEKHHGCAPDMDGMTVRLNNNGDQLSLWHDGSMTDFVAWEGGYDGLYEEWDLEAGEGESLSRKYRSESSPGAWETEGQPSSCS